jgi:hypothetical protein
MESRKAEVFHRGCVTDVLVGVVMIERVAEFAGKWVRGALTGQWWR